MKHILHYALVSLLLLPGWASGQSLLQIDQPAVVRTLRADLSNVAYEEAFTVNVRNTSQETLQLKWQRVEDELTPGWKTQICDDYASYPPDVFTNYAPELGLQDPLQLAPGETFDLYLTVSPYGIPGKARIAVPLTRVDQDEEIVETITFDIKIEDNYRSAFARARPKLFPNPAYNEFYVNADDRAVTVQVLNTLGRTVKTFRNITPGQAYPIGELPDGVYLVTLIDARGQRFETFRLLHRYFRP